MRVKEESEKADLQLNIKKTKIMASCPIISWQIEGEKVEIVTDFIFLDSKITADSDCSHEVKRCLLLGRKAMTNLDRLLKSEEITLPTKIHIVKAMVFPAVMYRCESWTIAKTECQRIDAFELWWWRRLLRAPCTARWSNHPILKEINPERSSEGLMLKLKLQYFGYWMQRADSMENTLMLGKTEGKREGGSRGWDGWITSPTQWTWIWANSGRQWRTGKPGGLQSVMLQRVGHDLVTQQQQQNPSMVPHWLHITLFGSPQNLLIFPPKAPFVILTNSVSHAEFTSVLGLCQAFL